LAVKDTARGHLTTSMVMEADVGRGLGLVRDLVERNGGGIHVAAAAGWSKAVVVEFDRVDGEVKG